MKTVGLTITSSIVTSLNEGLKANTYIVATGTNAMGSQKFQVPFTIFKDDTKEVKILAVFKDNVQIPFNAEVTLGEGVEASTTTILQALKVYLETKYSWTITEDTE